MKKSIQLFGIALCASILSIGGYSLYLENEVSMAKDYDIPWQDEQAQFGVGSQAGVGRSSKVVVQRRWYRKENLGRRPVGGLPIARVAVVVPGILRSV